MKYLIQAPDQPAVVGDYLDEMEARKVVRDSGLVQDMHTVHITPVYEDYYESEPLTSVTKDDMIRIVPEYGPVRIMRVAHVEHHIITLADV